MADYGLVPTRRYVLVSGLLGSQGDYYQLTYLGNVSNYVRPFKLLNLSLYSLDADGINESHDTTLADLTSGVLLDLQRPTSVALSHHSILANGTAQGLYQYLDLDRNLRNRTRQRCYQWTRYGSF